VEFSNWVPGPATLGTGKKKGGRTTRGPAVRQKSSLLQKKERVRGREKRGPQKPVRREQIGGKKTFQSHLDRVTRQIKGASEDFSCGKKRGRWRKTETTSNLGRAWKHGGLQKKGRKTEVTKGQGGKTTSVKKQTRIGEGGSIRPISIKGVPKGIRRPGRPLPRRQSGGLLGGTAVQWGGRRGRPEKPGAKQKKTGIEAGFVSSVPSCKTVCKEGNRRKSAAEEGCTTEEKKEDASARKVVKKPGQSNIATTGRRWRKRRQVKRWGGEKCGGRGGAVARNFPRRPSSLRRRTGGANPRRSPPWGGERIH